MTISDPTITPEPDNNRGQTKHWKAVEVQLRQASEFLLEPARFSIQECPLDDYKTYVDDGQFERAMQELETVALRYGCKSGFWKRLQKVANQLAMQKKVADYQHNFRLALAANSESTIKK